MRKRDARGRFAPAGPAPKPRKPPKSFAQQRRERANRKRSATMARRWEEAREFASRTGEPVNLSRRVVTVGAPYNPTDGRRRSSAAGVADEVRRLAGASRVIPPEGLPLRLTIRKAKRGSRVKMEARILIPGGATAQDIRRIIRDAWEAGVRARSKYYRELTVGEGGELYLDGERYNLELTPDTRTPDSSLTQPTRSPRDEPEPTPQAPAKRARRAKGDKRRRQR